MRGATAVGGCAAATAFRGALGGTSEAFLRAISSDLRGGSSSSEHKPEHKPEPRQHSHAHAQAHHSHAHSPLSSPSLSRSHSHSHSPAAAPKLPPRQPPGASTMICSNKYCRRTSPGDGPTCRWHVRNYGSEEEPINVTLCNACKINFDQGKYCPFCVQIYREKDPDSFDGKEWVGCTNKGCRRWVHVECEQAEGNDHRIGPDVAYQCPPCRENAEAGDRRRLGRHNAADRLASSNGEGGKSMSSPTPASDGDFMVTRSERRGSGSPQDKSPVLAKSFSWSGARLSAPRSESRASSPSSSLRHTPPVKVDLSKLQASSLRRYKRVYKLRDIPGGCKDGLKMAVAQHFATLVVNEEDIFRAFVQTCLRRHQGSVATADHAATLRNLRKLPKPTPEQGVS